jgi:hypothetical protein
MQKERKRRERKEGKKRVNIVKSPITHDKHSDYYY